MAKAIDIITNMKSQTFGVEIECYGISRRHAAKAAAQFFGTGDFRDTAHRNGYRCWSAYDSQGREWKFEYDSSIIAASDATRCEMVTPILTYEDMDLLQGVIRRLRKAGAKSDPDHSCGIHVHIGAKGHTAKTLKNLVNIFSNNEDIISEALEITRDRRRWCEKTSASFKEKLNTENPGTLDGLADVWYGTQGDYNRSSHYHSSRYHMLNLHSTFTKGTIEFRCFQFDSIRRIREADRKCGLHAGQVKAFVQFAMAISQLAKETKFTRANRKESSIPSLWKMRNLLNSLGFQGKEFKTCRAVFTRALSGTTASENEIRQEA